MIEDNYFDSGLRLMDKGDFEAAVAMFDSAIKLGLGDLAAIYLCRSEALLALGRWDEAEDSINSALAIEPYLAAAYNERGNIRRARRDNDLAINDYTMAIHIEPDYDEAHFNRALAYEARRRYAEAEADLTRALKLNPELKAAYEARGRIRAAQFKFDEAIADLSAYLRSGGGREYDNHSETQGYLLILRVQRLLWRLIPRRGRGDEYERVAKKGPLEYLLNVFDQYSRRRIFWRARSCESPRELRTEPRNLPRPKPPKRNSLMISASA